MESLRQMPLPALFFHTDYPADIRADLTVKRCEHFWDRCLGLAGTGHQGALLFPGTRGLHSIGFAESIWVIWLDADYQVVKTEWLHPNRFTTRPEGACHAVEVSLDTMEGLACDSLH